MSDTDREARKQARRDAWQQKQEAKKQRRLVVAQAKQQAAYARQQAAAQAAAARAAAEQAHYDAFMLAVSNDYERYNHFGADTVTSAIDQTMYEYYPVQPGFAHTYRWVNHGRRPDGTWEIEFLGHSVVMTAAEQQQRQHNDLVNAQFWNSMMISSAIRSHNRY
jgi:hypothetical protein